MKRYIIPAALFGALLLLSSLLLSSIVAAQDVAIRLKELPDDITLPVPPGKNLILTAQATGPVHDVWLATDRDSAVRIHLTPAGNGEFQVNLADPAVTMLLTARKIVGQFRLYASADLKTGKMLVSVPIRYAVRRAGLVTFKPFVWQHGSRFAVQRHGKRWYVPGRVERIEVTFDGDPTLPFAHLVMDGARLPLALDRNASSLSVTLTGALREKWHRHGAIELRYGAGGRRSGRYVLYASPPSLHMDGPWATFTVVQRQSEHVPGSHGSVIIRVGDVTGGQVLTDVIQEGEKIAQGVCVRRGDRLRFVVGKTRYTLLCVQLANFLIGDDFAAFMVFRDPPPADTLFEAVSQFVHHSHAAYRRGDKRVTPEEVERHIRRRMKTWRPHERTLAAFVEHVAGGDTLEVVLPVQKRVPFAQWLLDRALIFQDD